MAATSPSLTRESRDQGSLEAAGPEPSQHGQLLRYLMEQGKRGPQLRCCELSGQAGSYTVKVEVADNTEHVLALTMVRASTAQLCLTEDAKEECNIVEVVARSHDNEEIAMSLANMKLSCQPMLSLADFPLQPPVTFHLKSGSGPVHVTGRHQIVSMEGSDLSEEEDSEDRDQELLPILPAKKRQGKL